MLFRSRHSRAGGNPVKVQRAVNNLTLNVGPEIVIPKHNESFCLNNGKLIPQTLERYQINHTNQKREPLT